MAIPETYKVDFSSYRKDLIEQALSRMLSQHYDKCILRQFVAAILGEVQDLFDALIDLQEQRVLYNAESYNLEAIGRIVGESRTPYQYDEGKWFFADRIAQRVDKSAVWCMGAPFASFLPVEDEQYRLNILTRIIKNHTLVASIPELEHLTDMVIGTHISYEKTGAMQVRVIIPSEISQTAYNTLTMAKTDRKADESFMLPYPATLNFTGYITYVPDQFFCSDRSPTQCADNSPCAVGVPY